MKPATKKAPVKKTPVKATASATKAKPAVKAKPKAAPKAAAFGFAAMGGPFGGPKKGGKTTTFATAMESMHNLMGDLELVDTKGTQDFLNDPDKKSKLLNCIANNDYAKFEMILGMFKEQEESKEDVHKLSREVRTTLNESLMHLAVVHYVEKQDARYMKLLCDIHFPLYEEDQNGDIPIFALSLCPTDEEFIKGLEILLNGGYDINYRNSNGKDLLEFLSEFSITPERVEFMKTHGLASKNVAVAKSNIQDNNELSESAKVELLSIL